MIVKDMQKSIGYIIIVKKYVEGFCPTKGLCTGVYMQEFLLLFSLSVRADTLQPHGL